MFVAAVHRYPVKSCLGERLARADVDLRGLVGDRLLAVYDVDGKLGSGKSSRRFRRMEGLQQLRSRYDGDLAVLQMPDGRQLREDDEQVHAALSDHVGRPVTLRREDGVPHFDDGPVHLVTTASLRELGERRGADVDPRRLRPNLVVDTGAATGFVEDEWLGRTLAVGREVRLRLVQPMPRCVMATAATADLPPDPGLLRSISDHHEGDLGVLAEVVEAGTLREGDTVELLA